MLTHSPPRAAVVLLAAGEGRRVGADRNKVLLPLAGAPVFTWSLRHALELPAVVAVVLVVRDQDEPVVRSMLEQVAAARDVVVVAGGDSRHASERNALLALRDLVEDGSVDVVAIHDTARPLATPELFAEVIGAAAQHGGALPVVPQQGLVARDAGGDPDVDAAAKRRLVAVQTPQAFRARELLAAYDRAEADGFEGTDTASCIERYTELPIHGVPSDALNLKVTFPEDVALAERLLAKSQPQHRSGSPEPQRQPPGTDPAPFGLT